METKGQVWTRQCAKPLNHLVLAEVDIELVSSSDLRHNLDRGDQTLISHLCLLLLNTLVLLIVIA